MSVIGGTGSGKSTTCKSITGIRGNEVFEANDGLSSVTTETKGILTTWFGDRDLEPLIVLDTPGLGDSEGRDVKHIA